MFVVSGGFSTFSILRVLIVQSGRTSSDTLEIRKSLNTVTGLLSSGQYLWHRIWNVTIIFRTGMTILGIKPKTCCACYQGVDNGIQFPVTHFAFFITLCEHGDGAGSRLPDHPPKVCHRAGQRTLSGYELVGTQITLQRENKRQRGSYATQTKEMWLYETWDHPSGFMSNYSQKQSWHWYSLSPPRRVLTAASLGCCCLNAETRREQWRNKRYCFDLLCTL